MLRAEISISDESERLNSVSPYEPRQSPPVNRQTSVFSGACHPSQQTSTSSLCYTQVARFSPELRRRMLKETAPNSDAPSIPSVIRKYSSALKLVKNSRAYSTSTEPKIYNINDYSIIIDKSLFPNIIYKFKYSYSEYLTDSFRNQYFFK
jgi:hypothetical protein